MQLIPAILRSKKKKGLYYLLPGMNTSNRRRRREIFKWSLLVCIIVSAIFGWLIYFINSR